jgi:hypothetical protein
MAHNPARSHVRERQFDQPFLAAICPIYPRQSVLRFRRNSPALASPSPARPGFGPLLSSGWLEEKFREFSRATPWFRHKMARRQQEGLGRTRPFLSESP